MKKFLRNLLVFPTLFTSIFSGYGKIMVKIMVAVPIILEVGRDVYKIVNKNKTRIIASLVLPFIFNSSVKAGYLSTRSWSSLGNPNYVGVWHKSGATEGADENYDYLFSPLPWNPAIDFYSKTSLPYPADKLKKDVRPPESTTSINIEISGRGLGDPENATLQFVISYPQGEDNFSWKNIIGELSQRVDDGNGGYKYALIGNYDIKNLVNSATTISISINNGETIGSDFFPSHKLDYSFFHYCDFNRDRQTNGLDFAIFSDNFGRNNETDPNTFGSYVGSEPNNFNAYADIDRNGSVDFEDLEIFKTYFKSPGDLNLDGRVDLDDFAYLSADWNATDVNSVADISGPDGIPDKNVDYWDLGAFSDDYLRDINEPGTWSRVR
jgi:hypothetical protein